MSSSQHSAKNRRAFPRAETSADGRLFEVQDHGGMAAPIACEVTDLSRGGMGVVSRRMLHIGSTVIVVLPSAEGDPRILAGQVRNIAYAGNGLHRVGVQFCAMPEVSDRSVLFRRAA